MPAYCLFRAIPTGSDKTWEDISEKVFISGASGRGLGEDDLELFGRLGFVKTHGAFTLGFADFWINRLQMHLKTQAAVLLDRLAEAGLVGHGLAGPPLAFEFGLSFWGDAHVLPPLFGPAKGQWGLAAFNSTAISSLF
jgi:hypothetical protein